MALTPMQRSQVQQCVVNLLGMGGGTFQLVAAFDKATGQMLAVSGPSSAPFSVAEIQALGASLETAKSNFNGVLNTQVRYLGQAYTVGSGLQGSNPLLDGLNASGGHCIWSQSMQVILVATIVTVGPNTTLDGAKNMFMGQIGQLMANTL